MLHESTPLPPSKKVKKFTDAVAEQRATFRDRQADEALRRDISLIDRLDNLEQKPKSPQENAGPLGIDWSIT